MFPAMEVNWKLVFLFKNCAADSYPEPAEYILHANIYFLCFQFYYYSVYIYVS